MAPLAAELNCCFSVFMPLTVRSRLQGSQPVGNLLNACGVQRRSVRYRGCWTPPPAACQTPRRPSPKAPSMGADLDRTSACARTMLGIFEPECRVPGLRQSAAALLRQIAWAGLIWTGHSRSSPPLLRQRPPGWRGVLRPLRTPSFPRPCRAFGRAALPPSPVPVRRSTDRRAAVVRARVTPTERAAWQANGADANRVVPSLPGRMQFSRLLAVRGVAGAPCGAAGGRHVPRFLAY